MGFYIPLPIRFTSYDSLLVMASMPLQKSGNLTVPANAQQVTRPRARRAKTGRFSTLESDRLVALIAVFEKA
jgi:hypothetical protein